MTEKQVEVLELVLQHKSSKDIARELGISPKTVDQRLDAAREKLGVADRRAAARTYAKLRDGTWEESPYPPFPVPSPADSPDLAAREPGVSVFSFADATTFERSLPWENATPTVLPEEFHGPGGTAARLNAIFGMALKLLAVVLVGLGVAQALTVLIRSG